MTISATVKLWIIVGAVAVTVFLSGCLYFWFVRHRAVKSRQHYDARFQERLNEAQRPKVRYGFNPAHPDIELGQRPYSRRWHDDR